MNLLSPPELERSDVVANCRMNRERTLDGTNGYAKELRLHPLEYLQKIADCKGHARWLDLCCGSGRALVEASQHAATAELNIEICGVDLFVEFPRDRPTPTLIAASLSEWQPKQRFDLISCVHGLHYIGDKLGLLSRVASWLTPNGRFVANFDISSIKLTGDAKSKLVRAELERAGFHYDARRKLIQRQGASVVTFPFEYLGANDEVGPNYTGQPAVEAHYRRARASISPSPNNSLTSAKVNISDCS